MSGYKALHDSAAWIDISSRGRLRASGEDRLRLLHAIASNAVEGLVPGQGTYAFFLSAQGRIQSDARLFVAGDEVWIDCEPEQRHPLREHIESYIIMDDVALSDAGDSVAALALEGPRSEEIARAALGDVLPGSASYSHRLSKNIRALRSTITGQPGLWFFCAPALAGEIAQKLEVAGAVPATGDDFRVVRVENRRPRFGEDYSNSNIPHETQLLQALSFTKGCYLGQEIVERVRSRGQVNKLLSAIELDTQEPPVVGTPVVEDGREAGRISSPVFSPRSAKVLAFAILRRELAAPGSAITAAPVPDGAQVSGRVLGAPGGGDSR